MSGFFQRFAAWLGLPRDLSAEGYHIDVLIGQIHLLMALLGIGWGIFFAVALWRFRASRQPRASASGPGGKIAMAIVAVVFVCELSLMVFIEMPLWADRLQTPEPAHATTVRVVGEQFAWTFHYPGEDGVFGRTSADLIDGFNPLGLDLDDPDAYDDLVTINQLHVPLGRQVLLLLSAKDVIHGFSIPHLRVKQDAIPGRVIAVAFEPTETGVAEIACAQLCGLSHYRMRGVLTIEEEDDFQAWYEDQLEYM